MRIDKHQNAYLDSGKSLDLNVNISGLSIDGHGNLASGNDDANYSTDHLSAEERRGAPGGGGVHGRAVAGPGRPPVSVEPCRPGTLRVLTIDQKNLDHMIQQAREVLVYGDLWGRQWLEPREAPARELAELFLWLTGMPR